MKVFAIAVITLAAVVGLACTDSTSSPEPTAPPTVLGASPRSPTPSCPEPTPCSGCPGPIPCPTEVCGEEPCPACLEPVVCPSCVCPDYPSCPICPPPTACQACPPVGFCLPPLDPASTAPVQPRPRYREEQCQAAQVELADAVAELTIWQAKLATCQASSMHSCSSEEISLSRAILGGDSARRHVREWCP